LKYLRETVDKRQAGSL